MNTPSPLASSRPVRRLLALAALGLVSLPVLAAGCGAQVPGGTEAPGAIPAESVGQARQADATSTCVTITRGGTGNIADATIDALSPTQNYGSAVELNVSKYEQSLLSADLSSIPAGSTVTSATLSLTVNGGGGDTNPVNFHAALAPWSEGTVTYASFNESYSSAIAGSLTGPSGNRGGVRTVDLTALTRAWVSGAQPNYGVLLETVPQNRSVAVYFSSSEGGPGEPALTVCYEPGPIHEWKFDEAGGGTTAIDSIGNANGTFGADASRITSFDGSQAALLNPKGTCDLAANVDFGAAVGAFGTADFSVTFWFATASAVTYTDLIGNRVQPSGGNFFSARMGRDGNIGIELDQDDGMNHDSVSSEPLVFADSKWHNVAYTRTAAALSLYVDGALLGSETTTAATDILGENPFQIGLSLPGCYVDSIVAAYDDVRIYDRAISPAEAAALAAAYAGTPITFPPVCPCSGGSFWSYLASYPFGGACTTDGTQYMDYDLFYGYYPEANYLTPTQCVDSDDGPTTLTPGEYAVCLSTIQSFPDCAGGFANVCSPNPCPSGQVCALDTTGVNGYTYTCN